MRFRNCPYGLQRATTRVIATLAATSAASYWAHRQCRVGTNTTWLKVIKRLTDRGFGFIETSPGNDIFFHMSNVDGVRFEDLREGQKVSFDEGQGPKGPRAENVRPL